MSQPPKPAAEPAPARSLVERIADRITGILGWCLGSRIRMIVTGALGMISLGMMFAGWSYFGQIALEPVEPENVEQAIAALDAGRLDEAKSLVGQMQRKPASPELLGGALFVLGAVKAYEAEAEVLPDRRRLMHEIAARYLQKASALGLPGERQGRAAFLLGKSLANSGQWEAAIPALEEALRDKSQPATEIHALLVSALLEGPESNLAEALKHNEQVLADPKLPREERDRALIISAGTLLRLQRYRAARDVLVQISKDSPDAARAMLFLGRLKIEEAQAMPEDGPKRSAKLDEALTDLQAASELDGEHGAISRQSALWQARRFELLKQDAAALAEYDRIGAAYDTTPEGLTALLAAADYYRRGGQFDRALIGYRQVLREMDAQVTYDSALMPLSDVRRRLTTVYQQCVDEERFAEALTLVELFEPVFGRASCAEMQAKTFHRWGDLVLQRAHEGNSAEEADARKDGRGRLREAGRAYEELARLRFAARQFTDDLWTAADCYFRGQSFTNAARLLEEYLHHEARRQNALALLKLGQSRLASREYDKATSALEECIEMFPDDAVTHQARLECARAYQFSGRAADAEKMLVTNLAGGSLKPTSPEWRDSLFALGDLLYMSGRYDEAINKLQEAVERYPEEQAALPARYTIARSYQNAAEAPAKRLQEAKSENERQAVRVELNEKLAKAHESYLAVQRKITLRGSSEGDSLDRALLRNCYLMQGAVLFELRRFDEALQAYGNVITSYQNDPIALESFVQAANCWRRLNQPVRARVTLDQAKMVLKGLPQDADFLATTNFNRQQWELLLAQMSNW